MQLTGREKEELKERIVLKVRQIAGGCWQWDGAVVSNRYAGIKVSGKLVSVRRLCYTLWRNVPPLGDFTVKCICKNTRCVNPRHLVRGEQGKGGGTIGCSPGRKTAHPWQRWF